MLVTHLSESFNNKIKSIVVRNLKPKNLTRLVTKMPMKFNQLIIEKTLNYLFSEQIIENEFEFLNGRILQITIEDANLIMGISAKKSKLCCTYLGTDHFIADAYLSIDTSNAILLANQKTDPDTLFFQRKLKIKGDTELVHHTKNIIDSLAPDIIPNNLLKLLAYYKEQVLH